jgi:proton glutamate symport protein
MRFVGRISLTWWIIIAMIIGVAVGAAFPDHACAGVTGRCFSGADLKPLSTVFLRMIKSIIVPIIFSTLVIGIAGHGDDMKRVGRLALKSIIYFEVVTTLALFIGLGAVNLVKPGVGGEPGGAGRPGGADGRNGQGAHLLHLPGAHRPAELLRGGGAQRGAADRLLVHPLRVGLSQVRGRPKELLLGVMRGAGGGDVQVHRLRDALRAHRHRCGHRGHGQPQRAGCCATWPC